MTYAHAHEDYDHDLWFSAYLPQEEVGPMAHTQAIVFSHFRDDPNHSLFQY